MKEIRRWLCEPSVNDSARMMKQIQTAYDVHEHVFLQFGESITESAVSKVREEKIP